MKSGVPMGVILGVGTALSAYAADLPPQYIEPAPIVSTWEGAYVGAQLGYGWSDFDATLGIDFLGTPLVFGASGDMDGFIGGAHLGYNWQHERWVFGLEGDIEATGIDGTAAIPVVLAGPVTVDAKVGIDWQASLRARLGYDFGSTLAYITGGLAVADIDVTASGAGTHSFSETAIGWTIGAGFEYALSSNWTARLEYRYTDLDSVSGSLTPDFTATTLDVDFDGLHAARLGVSYRF